ncbi:MAG: AgmX/PglI C-terminal domain-containing protein [Deltaproteobacteria bacterium]|nr:AgmX/PglI C-terminal domain-containing protein [Deltaproteobacteria bacterium]
MRPITTTMRPTTTTMRPTTTTMRPTTSTYVPPTTVVAPTTTLTVVAVASPAPTPAPEEEILELGGLEISSAAATRNSQQLDKKLRDVGADINGDTSLPGGETVATTTPGATMVTATNGRNEHTIEQGEIDVALGESLSQAGSVSIGEKQTHRIVLGSVTTIGDPEFEGSISPKVLIGVIQNNLGGVRSCYERYLKFNANISGRLYVEISVGTDGKVANVKILDDTLNYGDLTDCIVKKIYVWKFPPPDGGPFKFSYPFNFVQSLQLLQKRFGKLVLFDAEERGQFDRLASFQLFVTDHRVNHRQRRRRRGLGVFRGGRRGSGGGRRPFGGRLRVTFEDERKVSCGRQKNAVKLRGIARVRVRAEKAVHGFGEVDRPPRVFVFAESLGPIGRGIDRQENARRIFSAFDLLKGVAVLAKKIRLARIDLRLP